VRGGARFVESVTFELPGLTSSGHRVNATDLSGLPGDHIEGLLGYDFIRRYVITLDYAAGQMTIAEPATFTCSGAGESFPIRFRGRGLILKAPKSAQERI
jgi:hypothetical protein